MTPFPAVSAKPERGRAAYVYGADLVRFISAVMVGVFHLTWLDPRDAGTAWFGWIGVQVFFVISGFVIARSAENARPMKFVQSRFLRLYPAAWICAVITLALLIAHEGFHLGLGLRFITSVLLYPTGPFLASAYWTLPIEITFYLLIFLVLRAGKFDRIERIATWLALASTAYIVVYSLYRVGVLDLPGLEFDYDWKNLSLLRHGIYFSCGIFIWFWSEKRLSRLGGAALVLTLLAAVLEITCRSAEVASLSPAGLSLWRIWPIPVALWLASCAAIAASAHWRAVVLRAPAPFLHLARIAGLMTYPFYLLHEELGETTRDFLSNHGLPILPSVFLALALTAGVALLVAQVAEPALRNVMRAGLARLGTTALAGDFRRTVRGSR